MSRAQPSPLDLADLQTRIGHQFSDLSLLTLALTHASSRTDRLKSNERLEFLGDRVLGLCVSELLYRQFPGEVEGELAYRFTALVRKEALAEVAQDLGLGADLSLSNGERSMGGKDNPSILADACEAVIGAIYLDAGLAAAKAFVGNNWQRLIDERREPEKDAKTLLQEHCQKRGLPLPKYSVISEEGPSHAPVFTIRVSAKGQKDQQSDGPSKQIAQQKAAQAMLDAWRNKE